MDNSTQILRSRVEVLKKEVQENYTNLRSEIRHRHFCLILYISCVVFLILVHSKPEDVWEHVVHWTAIGINTALAVSHIFIYRRNNREDKLHKFVVEYSSVALSDHLITEMEIEDLAMGAIEAAKEDRDRPNPGNRLN